MRPNTPVGYGALLSDGVTPHGEAHAHNGAGDEDQEDHKGTHQEVEKGIEEGAAGRDRDAGVTAAAAQQRSPAWRGPSPGSLGGMRGQ